MYVDSDMTLHQPKYAKYAIIDIADTISTNSKRIKIPVGSKFDFNTISLSVEVCSRFSSKDYKGNGALLNVYMKNGEFFSNWVFDLYPGIALPKNTTYEISLVKCEN